MAVPTSRNPAPYVKPTASLFPYLTASDPNTAQSQILAQRSTQTPERRTALFDTMFTATKAVTDANASLPKTYSINKTFEAYGGKVYTPEQRTQFQATEQKAAQAQSDANAAQVELFGPKPKTGLAGIMSLIGPIATVVAPVLAPAIFGAGAGGFLGGTIAGIPSGIATQVASGAASIAAKGVSSAIDPQKAETRAAGAALAKKNQQPLITPGGNMAGLKTTMGS